MSLRRTAAALAASTVLCAVAAPVAAADESPSAQAPAQQDLPSGLYGKDDPQYDGVWRQSTALLAQDAAGVEPAGKAVDWLAGQQCEDGSFASYRPDPSEPCTAETVADVNATAAAVQALAALGGHGERVERAVEWLRLVQNDDGGWGFNPGSPSDANSVSVVIGALAAAGEDPAETLSAKEGKSPYDSLLGFQLGCDAEEGERGAFAYQPDEKGRLAANDDATAAAVLAARGEGLAVEPGDGRGGGAAKALDCGEDGGKNDGERTPAEAAEAGAAYLTEVLEAGGGHLRSAMPGAEEQPDHGNTADAVIALAAGGHRDAAERSLAWLEKNLGTWDKATTSPAALGQLVLATRATGGDPADFGGVNLVERLNATGPTPASVPAGDGDRKGAAEKDAGKDTGKDGNGALVTWSLVGAGLAAGAGIGFLVSSRRRRAK
ncbi:prenyltransferase/squalene oxidase repeat-containing protein [Streptomyces sp. DH37]|uniref:prenyltransferase/squalene oxidase repeat-containing protein n=1 Tax=Streptomyces sp. DH37 TaxID=3040122 RepID=UPI0024419BA7|nr:terpene cyclase/mutase family protein [Streptomyces sp. DH37]MDG9701870.1 terpene cyclase/mutase family protein [Streptomyces sp. DH37]